MTEGGSYPYDHAILPLRDDIAAPELPGKATWIGKDPGKMPVLTAKGPVLVHFLDYSQLNSVRTLPYLVEWHERYEPLGLRVLGVQAPRFPFGADPEAAGRGLRQLGVEFPVLIDESKRLWTGYGCEGWPSLFLWGRGGILRWFHFGEGDYQGTEQAIQEALAASFERLPEMPAIMEPVRPTDAAGVEVSPPSPEVIPFPDRPLTIDDFDALALDFEGGGAYVTADGKGDLRVTLDGEARGEVGIDGPGLYPLVETGRHGSHKLGIELEGAPEIWSVSYSPATT
ncbi:MAG TPA: hypothetical protein PLE93_05805 [Solirubrobacterales bacterium]|nr:hypothetical protein [Solirubrobacterales bacterium]